MKVTSEGTAPTASDSAAALYSVLLAHLMMRPHLRMTAILTQMLPKDNNLPPSDRLSQTLAQIDQLKTWLDSFRPLSPAVLRELKQRYDVRFTYSSNAIEGNTLSQSETEIVLSKGITIGGKTLIEHLEVIGHKEAIDYIETLAQATTPVGEWEIRQIHSLVMRTIAPTEAGRYRQLDVKAAGTEHVYPAHYLLPRLMDEFVRWLAEAHSTLHPVVYACEAHYRFVSIHPFADGNGRTGRLMMNLLLLKAGFPIVSISNQQRAAYIEALAVAPSDDLALLLALVCEATRHALIETLSVIASAAESKGKGHAFYEEVVAFLKAQADFEKRPPSE
ncbi:MAG: Fic family protein, partial [Phormidesmis sp.]